MSEYSSIVPVPAENHEREIDKLAEALAQAQGEFPPVPKTGKNPHLGNSYATLDDVIGAIRAPLAKHGLAFTQLLGAAEDGTATLRTMLIHKSGQYIESSVRITLWVSKGINELQALGGALTYMKRYALCAMLGIAADTDTDGNGATPRRGEQRRQPAGQGTPPAPKQDGDGDGKQRETYSPKRLYDGLLKKTLYYNSERHCFNTMRRITGDKAWTWPAAADLDGWMDTYNALLEYAESKVGAEESAE